MKTSAIQILFLSTMLLSLFTAPNLAIAAVNPSLSLTMTPAGPRHNVCQLKKKTRPLANVDYTTGINPTAQSHNQGGGS